MDGHHRYTLAISGFDDQQQFEEREAPVNVVAHAELFTTGGGSLPQLESVQRLGERKRYLALAGTYQKPNGKDSAKGRWTLLTDLLRHRSWSVHW